MVGDDGEEVFVANALRFPERASLTPQLGNNVFAVPTNGTIEPTMLVAVMPGSQTYFLTSTKWTNDVWRFNVDDIYGHADDYEYQAATLQQPDVGVPYSPAFTVVTEQARQLAVRQINLDFTFEFNIKLVDDGWLPYHRYRVSLPMQPMGLTNTPLLFGDFKMTGLVPPEFWEMIIPWNYYGPNTPLEHVYDKYIFNPLAPWDIWFGIGDTTMTLIVDGRKIPVYSDIPDNQISDDKKTLTVPFRSNTFVFAPLPKNMFWVTLEYLERQRVLKALKVLESESQISEEPASD